MAIKNKLVIAIISILATFSDYVGADESVSLKAKNQLAFVSNAESAIESDPSSLAAVSVLNEIIKSRAVVDAQELKIKIKQSINQTRYWRNISTGSLLDLHVYAFAQHAKNLKRILPNSDTLVLAAQKNLLGDVFYQTQVSSDAAWFEVQLTKRNKIITEFYNNCRATPASKLICNEIIPILGFSGVASSYNKVCASKPTESWCQALNVEFVMSKEPELRTILAAAIKEAQDGASACINGNSANCGTSPDREGKVKKISNTINTAASALKYIGAIDKSTFNQIKIVGQSTVTIFQNTGKLFDSLEKINVASLPATVTDWGQWKNYLFSGSDATNTDLGDLIKIGESIWGSVSSISGAVSAVMSLFGHSLSTGQNLDVEILQQIHVLQDMISNLKETMNARFDIVDTKLDTILYSLITGLDTINSKIVDTQTKLNQVQAALTLIDSKLTSVSANMAEYFGDASQTELLQYVQGLDRPINQREFDSELTFIYLWTLNSTGNSINAGPTNRDFGDGIVGELKSNPIYFNINYLNEYYANVLGGSGFIGGRVSNPAKLILAMRLYLKLLDKYPAFTTKSSALIEKHLKNLLGTKFSTLDSFLSTIQISNGLMNSLITDLNNKYSALNTEIGNAVPAYLHTASPVGIDYSGYNIWGNANQSSSYSPELMRQNKIYPCAGTFGNPLTVPSSLSSWIDNSAINAEALGVSKITSCYSMPDNYGWGAVWYEKIKVDRYWAWGGLDITINTFINGRKINSRLLSYPDLQHRGYLHGQRDGICYFFTTNDIRIASSAVPAWNVVAAAWEDGSRFVGNEWCNFSVVSNLKSLFNSNSTTTYDWKTVDPTSKATIDAAVSSTFATLRHNFYASVATSLKNSLDPVGLAARRVDGSLLALRSYLELAFPQLLIYNPIIRSAFYGSNALPNSSEIIATYAVADGSNQQPIDFLTNSKARSANLLKLLEAEVVRIQNGQAKYFISDIVSVENELNMRLAQAKAKK